ATLCGLFQEFYRNIQNSRSTRTGMTPTAWTVFTITIPFGQSALNLASLQHFIHLGTDLRVLRSQIGWQITSASLRPVERELLAGSSWEECHIASQPCVLASWKVGSAL